MKQIRWMLLAALASHVLPTISSAQIYLTTSDEITISGRCLDSSGFHITPDSVRIIVYRDGSECHDAWYNSADVQCAALNDMLVFTDAFGDIDADSGNGLYEVMAGFFEDNGDLYNWKTLWVYLGVDMAELGKVNDSIEAWDDEVAQINNLVDSLYAVLDSLQSQDDWVSGFDAATEDVMLASGELDDVWRNRDTANVDSSDIGAWLVNNLGSTGGGDSTSIARWVWNTPQVNHTVAGTFGRYLDTEVSGVSSGSGLYSYTIRAYDTILGQVVSGVRLAVRNVSQTSLIAVGATDSQGEAGFNLDADSFVVVAVAPGYVFSPYDTTIVLGTGVDTVFGSRFDPGAPASPGLCRVYGYVADVRSEPESSAAVSAYLPKGVTRSGDLLVSPFSVSTQTDSLGYFYLDLIPSDSLVGDDTSYEITISRHDGTIMRKRFKVPAQTSWQLVW